MKRLFIIGTFLLSVTAQSLLNVFPASAAPHLLGSYLCADGSGIFSLRNCPPKSYTAEMLRDEGILLIPEGSTCIKSDNSTTSCSYKNYPKPTDFELLDVEKYDEDFKSKNGHYPSAGERLLYINQIAFAQLDNEDPSGDDDWTTKDCTLLTGWKKTQCEAIKKCITDGIGNQTQCVDAWTNCIGTAENPANPTDAEAAACATKITTSDTDDPLSDQDTCKIDGIGWIVCPVAVFLGSLTDGAYAAVEQLLVFRLSTDPWSTDPAVNPTYTIWSNIRNVANVVFVIAFFAVVFSQATSMGISAYGIRKMLPKIIVAAILVNLSYYICLLAIDLSNIVGASLDGLIKSVPLSNVPADGDGTWEKVLSTVLAGGAIVGGVVLALNYALALLLPFVAFAFLAILTAIVVMVGRNALLIMLVILSPLAFVAYILPNTESIFDKWRKLFTTLLLMYPLIALLFAGSRVASQVLRLAAPDSALMQIFSLGVLAFPLFGVPYIVKFSGGMLGRLAGMVNDRSRGLVDRSRNLGKEHDAAKRAELGYRFGKGIRKLGDPLAKRTAGWGYDEDGKKKKGFRSMIGRRAGSMASAPSRVGFGKRDRESRMAQVKHAMDEEYWEKMSGKDIVTETDSSGQQVTRETPTAAAQAMARRASGVGGQKAYERVLRTATESQRKEFLESRSRYEGDASDIGLYSVGSNYSIYTKLDDGTMGWKDIGADTGGAALHLSQLGKIRVTRADGRTTEIDGKEGDGMMAKAAINMAAKAADGSALTRMIGVKGNKGVDSSLVDSLNQSIAGNAGALAVKFPGLFSGTDAINGATVDTVEKWHGGQFLVEGRRMAYIRNQAKTNVERAQADHAAGKISQERLEEVRTQSTAQLDQVQTWYNQVANSISVLKSRAAASGKTISSGKLEAFEQFKELATEKDNKYYDSHYDYLFKGGARPTAGDDSRYTGAPLPKDVMDGITRRVQQQVADMGQRTSSGSDEYAVVIPGATAAPVTAGPPSTSGETVTDGGLIIPHAAQRSAATAPPTSTAASSAAAAPDISSSSSTTSEPTVQQQRESGGNFGGFRYTPPEPPPQPPSGGSFDARGRFTRHKPDGTPMTQDEADEYHERFGGTGA